MANKVVAVLGDLIFTVRISDAAKRAGVEVQFVKSPDEALRKAEAAAAVILDLNYAPASLIRSLKSDEKTREIPLVGYVSHVQGDVIREAKASGCDTVLARSAFVQKLDEMMSGFAGRQVT